MVEVDDITGELIALLKKNGVLENILVFFTSDNGANEDTWPDSGSHPWRGSKGTIWEGGVLDPGIVYWKGLIEPGQINNGLMDLTDIYTTSLRLGGVMDKLPDNLYFDGIDQIAFLLAENGKSRRQVV